MSSRWFQVSLTEANIYVVANPSLRSGSPKRTKKRIATVPHLDLDFDIDGEARLTSLRASDTVPAPTAVLATSLDKYQILWRVDGFTFEQQKSTLKLLTIAFGSDPACTDCNRILHVPGLLNCEYDPAYPVSVEYSWDSTWNPDDFWLDISARNAMLSSRQSHRESIPVCTRIPNTTGRGFCMSLPTEMVRRSREPKKLVAGVESAASVPVSKS
jgi:RepB DNA-primase from phage plasmid